MKYGFTIIAILLSITTYARVFSHLEAAPVERWDEYTNISVVRDTLIHRSFPVLFLGSQQFFEKPPVWYWVAIVVSSASGTSPLSMRVIGAVAGLFTIFLTTYIAWRWWGTIAGLITWICLLVTNQLFTTNPGGIFSTHTLRSADVDSLHIFFLLIAFVTAAESSFIACAFATALAVLTKGPLGFVPLFLVSVMSHPSKTRHTVITAWLITLSVIALWYLYMGATFGSSFFQQHVGYQLLLRATSPLEGHNNPWWYYFSLLGNRHVFFSWEILLLSLFWVGARGLYKNEKVILTLATMTMFLLIPTLAATKLAWYLLPVYPFVSLLIGAAGSDIAKRLPIIALTRKHTA